MKKAIVTFSNGGERFELGNRRLVASLKAVKFDGDIFSFKDFAEVGSPDHDEVPYAFKPYCIKKIWDDYDLILWLDSAIYATQNLNPVFDYIEKNGYMFFDNIGWTLGDHTSDACLKAWGLTREQSFQTRMIMACCMGFNTKDPESNVFFNQYCEAATDGVSYLGDWHNNNNQVSEDNRVKGHRHDQSVASIIIAKMNLKLLIGHETFFTYFGNPGMMPVAPTVSLYSHGY